jgi:clorobiocin biosynthesis protein CloN7
LDVPGARLYYERRGAGPLLLLIGSPVDSVGFGGLADALADQYTVVTYDPRGLGKSSREDTGQDVTPEQQADDVHRLLAELGGAPADVFGGSGGAVTGLALVTAHPGAVRTLVAHEPPVIECLPDRAQLRAGVQDIYDTYQAEGMDAAIGKFWVWAGSSVPPLEQIAQIRASLGFLDFLFAHLIRPLTSYQPDIAALRAAPTRIVVAVGAQIAGGIENRAARALAAQLGTRVVEFPGDHGGYLTVPEEFGGLLDQVLTQSADPADPSPCGHNARRLGAGVCRWPG